MIAPVARLSLLLAAVLGLLLAAPAADAASRSAIIRDCEDDSRLSGTYTARELREARSNLPSDTDAYSDCRDVLGAALAASAARGRSGTAGTGGSGPGNAVEGGAGAGGASGAATPAGDPPAPALEVAPGATPVEPTRAEDRALCEVRAASPDEQRAVAGIGAVAGQAAGATLPTSLWLLLVLLSVTAVLAAVPYARRRVLSRRSA